MDALVSPRSALPVPVTGDRRRWIVDGAVVGGVTGYVGPAAALFGYTLHPWLVACALSFAVGGALFAAAIPPLLERLRGRVSLPLIGALLTSTATLAGLLWAAAAAGLVGAPVVPAATYGAVAAGTQVALFWLPYTVLAVLGWSRWPVVLLAAAGSAGLGWLAWAVFAAALALVG